MPETEAQKHDRQDLCRAATRFWDKPQAWSLSKASTLSILQDSSCTQEKA